MDVFARSYCSVHSQFGKEGKKEAVLLYQRSADIAVLTYGYEHPISVAGLHSRRRMQSTRGVKAPGFIQPSEPII
jgi:hypothetical protein